MSCPMCQEGRARIPRGSAFVHLSDIASTIVGCGEQPGYDPEAFNRAVDTVVAAVEPWEPAEPCRGYEYGSPCPLPLEACENQHGKPWDGDDDYEPPFAYSYHVCPVCGTLVLPGDNTSGQMYGRPLHARCMAEYTADLDDHNESR